MKIYSYKAVPLKEMVDYSLAKDPTMPHAYVTRGEWFTTIRDLLYNGYRWVRTELDMAILEQEEE